MGAKPGGREKNTVCYKDVVIYRRDILEKVNYQNVDYAQQYLKNLMLNDISSNAKSNKIFSLTSWFDYIYENQEDKCVTELNENDLEEYFYYMSSVKNNKASTISHHMGDISAFYIYLRKKGIMYYNPMDNVKRPNIIVNEDHKHYLSEEKVEELKVKLKENGDLQLEVYALFSLSTGARATAVASVRWEQIDFDKRMVLNVKEKNHKVVTLYFNKNVKELLLNLKQYREDNNIQDGGYVFITYTYNYCDGANRKPMSASALGNWCKKIGKLIDVPELHPHDFRYTAGNLMLQKGGDIGMVSLMLNHSNLATTFKHYISRNQNEYLAEYKDKFDF